MTPQLRFLGGAETVTGSRALLQVGDSRVLVDCGLFQGYKKLRMRNWAPLPIAPAAIDAVVLTHAHIDHTGYLPRLVADGFRGPVYCTAGTLDLSWILLPDSGYLQEEDARRANKYGYTRHRPALPLYTRDEAVRSLELFRPMPLGTDFEVVPGVSAGFRRAGHIVGSASVRLCVGGVTVTFSGDVGRPHDPIMRPPEPLAATDVLVVESTYGDRRHPAQDPADILARVVHDTVARGGTVVVPVFAVGRAQHLLHLLAMLRSAGRIPDVPVYLDSPMAIRATKLFCAHRDEHALSDEQCHAMCELPRYTNTPDESKAIDRSTTPAVVLSASGMATGGRILHHLRRFLPDARSTVLFVGFQAAGTRGRALIEGADELKIHGQYVPVRARVERIEGLSAHADYAELLAWLRASDLDPARVFVNHGEPAAADAFRRRLRDAFGWEAVVPDQGSTWPLHGAG